MSLNFETSSQGPPSMIKYQPPIDITHKLDSYNKAITPDFSHDTKLTTQDILNIILPPREWSNNHNEHFLQYVSHDRPERQDVEIVKKKIEGSLLRMQAKVEGICPIRQQLFGQLFDQIIRQVTLDCPQRGLMLMRVRDQRKMTISVYQTVFEEGVDYGLLKQSQTEQGMEALNGQLKGVEAKRAQLQRRKQVLLSKKASMQQKFRERRAVETEKREYEISALQVQNQNLQLFMKDRRITTIQVVQKVQQQL